MRVKVAKTYTADCLETERPQPLADNKLERLVQEVLSGNIDKDISDQVYVDFKCTMQSWLTRSNVNNLIGFNNFKRVDIINGCTQFIDNLYMQGKVQTLIDDYKYHERLGNTPVHYTELKSYIPLVVAMPFPSTGNKLHNMEQLLDICFDKHIPVHIDGAWVTCCRDIEFDLSHPAIQSVGISLSKGLGLGWNRIGLRWSKDDVTDSISIMNDFRMNNRALVMIGTHFLKNVEPDYLWNTHGDRYYKVCNDFNLTPTNSIYLALNNNSPVGVSPLIRYLENNE
jgi:hypothetical protein